MLHGGPRPSGRHRGEFHIEAMGRLVSKLLVAFAARRVSTKERRASRSSTAPKKSATCEETAAKVLRRQPRGVSCARRSRSRVAHAVRDCRRELPWLTWNHYSSDGKARPHGHRGD